MIVGGVHLKSITSKREFDFQISSVSSARKLNDKLLLSVVHRFQSRNTRVMERARNRDLVKLVASLLEILIGQECKRTRARFLSFEHQEGRETLRQLPRKPMVDFPRVIIKRFSQFVSGKSIVSVWRLNYTLRKIP